MLEMFLLHQETNADWAFQTFNSILTLILTLTGTSVSMWKSHEPPFSAKKNSHTILF